jgi:hypothetical protein
MKLELIGSNCTGGPCPTIYRTDENSFIMQGRVPRAILDQLILGNDETAVEIPADLVEQLVAKLRP